MLSENRRGEIRGFLVTTETPVKLNSVSFSKTELGWRKQQNNVWYGFNSYGGTYKETPTVFTFETKDLVKSTTGIPYITFYFSNNLSDVGKLGAQNSIGFVS